MYVLLLCIKIASGENVVTLSFMTQLPCIFIATLFKAGTHLTDNDRSPMTGPHSLGMGKGKTAEQKQIATGWS